MSCLVITNATTLKKVIEMHCCAHRLELAIKNSAVGDPYLKVMDDFLENLYKLYHYSPVCWHGLHNEEHYA